VNHPVENRNFRRLVFKMPRFPHMFPMRARGILFALMLVASPCVAADFQNAKIISAFTAADGSFVTVQVALSDGKSVRVIRFGPMFRAGKIVVAETKEGVEKSSVLTRAEADVLLPIVTARQKRGLPDDAQRLPVKDVPEKLQNDWWVYKSLELLHQGLVLRYPQDPKALEKDAPKLGEEQNIVR
jgi:hypothetical protein